MAKKIYLTKTDSLASVVGKIVKTKEEEITLYIPRGTEFASSRTNFILLKREAATAGKAIIIESVDEDALELADTAGIKAVNPFLHRRQRAVSDIVAVRPRESIIPATPKEESVEEEKEEEAPKESKKPRREAVILDKGELTLNRFLRAVIITGFLAVAFVLLMIALPKAKIVLNMEKKNLEFMGTMVTSAAIKENSFSNNQVSLRGVTFVEKRNITKSYPASGKQNVERKASGEIVIYNNFSTAPQTLVATTRFVAPDGKIYRLNNTITVPGAQSSGAKLIPSSIKALVTADKAGAEYNLASGVKLRIPGFQGTAKYDGFYAETKDPISGGLVGESSLPSEEDLASAKADAERSLEEATKTQLLFNLPPEVRVLSNAYEFKITNSKINETADESDKFTITVFGEAKLIGFREPELVEVIGKGLLGRAAGDFKPENYELEYGQASLTSGDSLNAPLKFNSVWTRVFDIDRFRQEAAGKNKAELQTLVFAIPGLQSGEARLWPFFVSRVPQNTDRIIVDVK